MGIQLPLKWYVAWTEAYLHTKWHLHPSSRLATADKGQKLGACALLGEGAWSPSKTVWPGPAEAYLHVKFHLGLSNKWPQ